MNLLSSVSSDGDSDPGGIDAYMAGNAAGERHVVDRIFRESSLYRMKPSLGVFSVLKGPGGSQMKPVFWYIAEPAGEVCPQSFDHLFFALPVPSCLGDQIQFPALDGEYRFDIENIGNGGGSGSDAPAFFENLRICECLPGRKFPPGKT